MSEEKKTTEHKYSVTFVMKVETTKLLASERSLECSDCL